MRSLLANFWAKNSTSAFHFSSAAEENYHSQFITYRNNQSLLTLRREECPAQSQARRRSLNFQIKKRYCIHIIQRAPKLTKMMSVVQLMYLLKAGFV